MKNIFVSTTVFLFSSLFMFITLSGCSSVPEVASTPNHNDIKIDGNQQDWGTSFVPVKNDNVAVPLEMMARIFMSV